MCESCWSTDCYWGGAVYSKCLLHIPGGPGISHYNTDISGIGRTFSDSRGPSLGEGSALTKHPKGFKFLFIVHPGSVSWPQCLGPGTYPQALEP